ncbi:hypothetical protein WJX77_006770 [Trebouxia sp. C0004]
MLRRSDSGPVQAASLVGPILLQSRNDQPAQRRFDEAVERQQQQMPESQLATTMSPTKQRSNQEFLANFGTAVRSLRADIPCTLQRSPNMDIFAANISFTDNISPRMDHQTNVVQGHEAYSRQLWSLRFHAALLFSKSHVEMLRMWQRDDKTIAVRWSVQCSPRLIGGVTGSKVRLDGISEYKFNDDGKVSKHTVDVINWNGLHNALGLKPSLLAATFLPTPSCCNTNFTGAETT